MRGRDHRRVSAGRERARVALFQAQRGRCGICGNRIRALNLMTIDHVWPRAAGGTDRLNTVVAHQACNLKKGARLPTGCEMLWLIVAVTGLVLGPRPLTYSRRNCA